MKTPFENIISFFKNPCYLHLSLLLGVCFAVSSCGKEKIDIDWIELNSGTGSTLTSVYFTDPNHGHAVGGDTWYRGVSLQTLDGGENWQMDTLGDKQLFSIHFNQDQKGHVVGIDGYLFKKESPQSPWNFNKLPNWNILRDVCFYDADNGVVVGGDAFKFGVIMKLGPNYTPVRVDTFENELSAVCFSDEKIVHVVGYGIILRSTDGGLTWTISETTGDFYRSMHFPTNTIGYIAGYSGSILKTTDAGENWTKLINGDKISVKNTPFRSIHFVNADKGYIVGDHGTFWRTLDGGNNWQIVKDFPKVDLYDVHVIENTGYIVGENGRIFRFED
jgi:photosystem II stability/assembly factor-like uncharacterized protein